MKDILNRAKTYLGRLATEKRGEGTFTDVVVVILIVAIVGTLVLAILNQAMPDLVNNVIDKIQTGIGGVEFSSGA